MKSKTKKARAARLPRSASLSRSAVAGIAATTRGRARVFKDKRSVEKSAREQIDDELNG
jgi:hypothetical protein